MVNILILSVVVLVILEFKFLVDILTTKFYKKEKELKEDSSFHENTITIVVPVKDEEKNIPNLIDSLIKNVKSRVILVDDYSIDNSYNLMKELTKDAHNIEVKRMIRPEKLKIKAVKYKINDKITFKTNATIKSLFAPRQTVLNFAYRFVKTEFVSVMDADVIVPRHWENRVTTRLKGSDIKFLYGYTYINPKSLVGHLESIELFFLFSCGFGLRNFGLPSSCMGNNITFSLKAFNDFGGYKATGFMYNDDQALLDVFNKFYAKNTVIGDYTIKLETAEIGVFKDASNQKTRWINDAITYDSFFIVPMMILLLASISLIFAPLYLKLIVAINLAIFVEIFATVFNERKVISKAILLNLHVYLAPIYHLIKYILFKRNKTKIVWKGNKL